MGGGNGAKAAQKRERAAKEKGGVAKSQLKTNAAAMNIQCDICKSVFLSTSREKALTTLEIPSLTEHATNKHSKALADCFPNFKP
ncbi:uncharacterized protein E0L32_010113 [Thyridium curvatum]|uniref:Uncharacterized protein n=1 Tax=Thyridium curvatum TaxID=1093900 RepID=A0A507ALF0_9PEZI|nr:uncharacterized protein E0L32_010113 [Thyridium curvatum]TPX08383.1 hypothetical protein E0L32_010113 [Thyridium curvatum]